MEYRYLGHSALQVSPLCLGAMMFGGETEDATSRRIIAKAHDIGINFIDTADVYYGGASEQAVGHAIAAQRDDWVVATKFGHPTPHAKAPNNQGQSRKWIMQTVENSLRNLGTDYLDILYFHRAIPGLVLEEGLRAIDDLIRQGKVRYYGISNFRAWQIAEMVRLADHLGMPRPSVTQPVYSIVDRQVEMEHLPAACHYGLGVATYSPLARGVLSGKYAAGATPPADSRAGRGDRRLQQTEWRAESLEIAERVAAYAASRNTTPVAFALAWIIRNQAITAAIAGPRTEAHWDGYVRALDVCLTDDDERFIDTLVPPGHASTHGYTDPAYPVEGRRTRA